MEEKMNFFEEKGERKEVIQVVDEEEEEAALPGFRFHPTDEELVGFYLRRMVEKRKPLSVDIIKQIDIYKYDPWDLPKLSSISENEWYFFCLRGRKYRNSIRPNRVTGSGFWKATGIDRPIYSNKSSGDCIGLKKSLVYYRGSAGKGTKTDWMMHEFRLPACTKTCNKNPPSISEAESWTICRIFKRKASLKKQIVWREGGGDGRKKVADCSSKTSSFESNGEEERGYFQGGNSLKNGESSMHCCSEEKGRRDSSGVAADSVDLQSSFVSLNESEILREGNWDEIGRLVEFLLEPATTIYDSVYF